jgi:hypothetical protein
VGAASGGTEVVGVAVGFMVCIFPFLPIAMIAMFIFMPFIIPLVVTGRDTGEVGVFGRVRTMTSAVFAGATAGAMGEVGVFGRAGVTTTDGWDIGRAMVGAMGVAGADGSVTGDVAGGLMGVEIGIGSFLCGGTAGISIGVSTGAFPVCV